MNKVQAHAHQMSIDISPEFGGSVKRLTWCDRDILRAGVGPDPRYMAGFPLFPFSGRINAGRFAFAGKSHKLPPNMPPEPHAIHGQGWQSAWGVTNASEHQIALGYTHRGDIWPWFYKAEQVFDLAEDQLSWTGHLTNLGQTEMPAGFGWHPYFPRKGAHINARVSAVWRTDERMIPSQPEPLHDLQVITTGFNPEALALDFAFVRDMRDETAPVCTIDYTEYSVEIFAAPIFTTLIIYTPPARDFFCIEPVSHAPDAVNATLGYAQTGLHILPPTQTLSGTIALRLRAKA